MTSAVWNSLECAVEVVPVIDAETRGDIELPLARYAPPLKCSTLLYILQAQKLPPQVWRL